MRTAPSVKNIRFVMCTHMCKFAGLGDGTGDEGWYMTHGTLWTHECMSVWMRGIMEHECMSVWMRGIMEHECMSVWMRGIMDA